MKKRIRVIALLPLIVILLTSCHSIPYADTGDQQIEVHTANMEAQWA